MKIRGIFTMNNRVVAMKFQTMPNIKEVNYIIFFKSKLIESKKNINDYLNLLLKLLCKEKWIVNKLLLHLLEIYWTISLK